MRNIATLLLIASMAATYGQQPGDLDSSFAVNGTLVLEDHTVGVVEIASLINGKILLMLRVGSTTKILRRNYDGSRDSTFADDGVLEWQYAANRMLVDGDERIYLVGTNNSNGILRRFLPDGELDLGYGVDGVPDVSSMAMPFKDAAIYPDGRLLITYDRSTDEMAPNSTSAGMFRLLGSGMQDPTFTSVVFPGIPPPCEYQFNACPMVRLGPMGEIYLARQIKQGNPCIPEIHHSRLNVLRYAYENDPVPIFTGMIGSPYGHTNKPVSIVPGLNGDIISNVYLDNYVLNTQCKNANGTTCSPALNMYIPGHSQLLYRTGVVDVQGHFLHTAMTGWNINNYKIVINRSTNYDLSPDPQWGGSGYVVYDDASLPIKAGLANQNDGKLLVGGQVTLEGIDRPLVLRYHNIPDPRSTIDLTINLGGAYDAFTGAMRDDLRQADLLPWMQPYAAPAFQPVNGVGSWAAPASVLSWTGDSAIVDWVWLELLDVDDASVIKATRVGLLHRNGKVTQADGIKPIDFSAGAGQYLLRVRHRNHLSVTLAEPITLGPEPTHIDLTDPATPTFGTNAQKEVNGKMMLWPGDANDDGQVKYAGHGNDRDQVLTAIGGVIPTNTTTGYLPEDINMDGVVKYTGENNDRDIILQTIGGEIPTAVRVEQGP